MKREKQYTLMHTKYLCESQNGDNETLYLWDAFLKIPVKKKTKKKSHINSKHMYVEETCVNRFLHYPYGFVWQARLPMWDFYSYFQLDLFHMYVVTML